ncbi:MAG TPA: alpha/beta hydrolase fold domain-containing protein [Mycobacterium sp.]|nr:alpha/beta hydrolase fold domain-containing protein [Mycobacterium sp.]
MKAIVIGGGIGGAATACALLREGVEVELYEQAAQFGEIGAGLQISANAVRVLEHLGVGAALREVGVAAEAVEFRDLRTDELLHHTSLGGTELDRLGAQFIQAQRPDLLDILVSRLPGGIVHLRERCVRFEEDADRVTAFFESGHTATGDVLIGADGIHSIVRDRMLGQQEPEFSKIIAWRALVPHDKIEHLHLEPKCHVWWGPYRSVVLYWVRHMRLLNFVGIVPSSETAAESWLVRGDVQAIRDSFRGCTERVAGVIDQIEDPFVTGYYFRHPLPRWSAGRVTILGDAAHPMHPFLAQGACQAIEDAAVLSRLLVRSSSADVPASLKDYQNKRLPRASRVQRASMDQERVWHLSDPAEIAVRNRQLRSMMEIDPQSRAIFGWIHEHDPYRLADRGYGEPWRTLNRPEAQRAWRMWHELASSEEAARGPSGLRAAYHRFLGQHFPPPADSAVERVTADGIRLVRVRAPAQTGRADRAGQAVRILHLHGGGYVCGSAEDSTDLAYRLSRATGGTVDVVDYRLAPEHPCPAAVDDSLQAYRWLLEHDDVRPGQILLTGESTGGGLALATALLARKSGLPMPAGVAAICPLVDLTLSGATIDARADTEPICSREFLTNVSSLYLQGHPPGDPLVSPLYGDLRGLPPLLIQVAENEALFSDAQRLSDAARAAGVDVEFQTCQDSVHVFPLFAFLAEAPTAIAHLGDFAHRVTGCR